METLFKNYFWVLNLLVLMIAAYLTATTVNEYVSDKLFGVAEPSADEPSKAEPSEDSASPAHQNLAYASLLEMRNVFDSDRSKEPEKTEDKTEETEKPTDAEGAMEETSLDLQLVGTLVAADATNSLATVRLAGAGKLVRVGSDLKRTPDDEAVLAKVREIHRRYIVILEGADTKVVRLWGERKKDDPRHRGRGEPGKMKPTGRVPPPRRGKPKVDYSKGVRKVSMYNYEVDRSMLDENLNDLSALGRQARVVPNYRNGQYQGFKLIGVRPGSLYRALGIRSGDIIQRVNGTEINSPNKAIELFERLRTDSKIALDIERRGQKRTLQFSIK